MLRATLFAKDGPIAFIGLNDENLKRMQAGMPLSINLEEGLPKNFPKSKIPKHVIIHLAHTYFEVVQDMEEGGMPRNESIRKLAREMDKEIENGKAS